MQGDLYQHYNFTTQPENVASHIYTVSSREDERYYLRPLLPHVPSATFFQHMRKFEGNIYPTHK